MKTLSCIALGMLTTTLGHAGTIVIDGGTTAHVTGEVADAMAEYYTIGAEQIELTRPVTFNQFDWWGAYAWGGRPSVLDNFALYIYSDAGPIPGALLSSRAMSPFNVNATGYQISFGGPSTLSNEYSYSALFSDVTLSPGRYYIGLERFGGFLNYGDPGYSQWVWTGGVGGPQSTSVVAGLYHDSTTPPYWVPQARTPLAFDAVYNAAPVPEPGTWALLASGLGLTLVASRRRT